MADRPPPVVADSPLDADKPPPVAAFDDVDAAEKPPNPPNPPNVGTPPPLPPLPKAELVVVVVVVALLGLPNEKPTFELNDWGDVLVAPEALPNEKALLAFGDEPLVGLLPLPPTLPNVKAVLAGVEGVTEMEVLEAGAPNVDEGAPNVKAGVEVVLELVVEGFTVVAEDGGAVNENPVNGLFAGGGEGALLSSCTFSTCRNGLGCRAREAFTGIKCDVAADAGPLDDLGVAELLLLAPACDCIVLLFSFSPLSPPVAVAEVLVAGNVKLLFSVPAFEGLNTKPPAGSVAGVEVELSDASGLNDCPANVKVEGGAGGAGPDGVEAAAAALKSC